MGHGTAGAVGVSAAIRLDSFFADLHRGMIDIGSYLSCLRSTRQTHKLANLFSVSTHPDLCRIRGRESRHRHKRILCLQRLVYRCDEENPFTNMSALTKENANQKNKQRAKTLSMFKQPVPQDLHAHIWPMLLLHIRKELAEGTIMQLPRACRTTPLGSAWDLPNPLLALDIDGDELGEVEDKQWFRIVKASPSQLRTVASDLGAGILTHALVVAPMTHRTLEDKSFLIDTGGAEVFHGIKATADVVVFLNGCCTCQLGGELHYSFNTEIAPTDVEKKELDHLLQALVAAAAFPSQNQFLQWHEDDIYVEHFKEKGLLTCHPSNPSQVQLTYTGMASLQAWQHVHPPIPFQVTAAEKPLPECSGLQLLLRLDAKGWKAEQAPKSRKLREVLRYKCVGEAPGEPGEDESLIERVWYYGRERIHRNYLLCLLSASDLHAQFGLEAVPHCRPDYVYAQLLEGVALANVRPLGKRVRLVADGEVEDPDAAPMIVGEAAGLHLEPMIVGEPGGLDLVEPEEEDLSDHLALSETSSEGDGDVPMAAGDGVAAAPMPLPAVAAPPVAAPGKWGAFTINFAPTKSAFGSFEVSCPYHRKNAVTGCKKVFRCASASDSDTSQALQLAKWWAVQANRHERQSQHLYLADTIAPPSFEALEGLCLHVKPDGKVRTDEELNEAEAEASVPAAKAKAKPGAKAKAAAKPKAKGKAKAKAKAAIAPGSSSSSSSSSTNSCSSRSSSKSSSSSSS
eukprot:1377556-Amphidinium_carterae.1